MGFGSGQTTYHRETSAYSDADGSRVKMIFTNEMVAHVWAQQSQDFGRSANGNISFRGRALYSYGDGFTVGYMLPTGLGIPTAFVALITADSYSISTSGHTSDAGDATRDKPRFYVPALTKKRDYLDSLAHFVTHNHNRDEAKAMRDRTRAWLLANADDLTGRRVAPGEWRSWDGSEETGIELGEHIGRLAGLPDSAWARIKAERAKLNARAKAKAERDAANKERETAATLADMPNSRWRSLFKISHATYSHEFARLAKQLYHAKRYAKAHGFSAKRLDSLRKREVETRAFLATFERRKMIVTGRSNIGHHIALIRSARDILANPETVLRTREGAMGKLSHSLFMLAGLDIFPQATRDKMRAQREAIEVARVPLVVEINRLAEIERAEARERAEREARERAEREAANRAAWLAGDPTARTPSGLNAESGGAAMRIVGDTLQTSWGASVPLAHAVKVFRFVKLCRETGTAWHRNGKTIRVGHFQVDSVDALGNFKAGCHDFTWPEVERVAALADVLDCPASDSAVEPSSAAA